MTTYPGRGAWTAVGKDNGKKTYVYVPGAPMDGRRKADGTFASLNHEAVNLAVKAIQKRITTLGYSTTLVADGVLGPASDKAIRWAQRRLGIYEDGNAGPNTATALWKPMVAHIEASEGIPHHILWGILAHESAIDPGAVGATTPADRGLVQFNTSLGSITIAQAHDPNVALPRAGERIRKALDKYDQKGGDLRLRCSIAQWNAPAWADQWYRDGHPPNDKIAKYVESVLDKTATF